MKIHLTLVFLYVFSVYLAESKPQNDLEKVLDTVTGATNNYDAALKNYGRSLKSTTDAIKTILKDIAAGNTVDNTPAAAALKAFNETPGLEDKKAIEDPITYTSTLLNGVSRAVNKAEETPGSFSDGTDTSGLQALITLSTGIDDGVLEADTLLENGDESSAIKALKDIATGLQKAVEAALQGLVIRETVEGDTTQKAVNADLNDLSDSLLGLKNVVNSIQDTVKTV